MLDSQNFSVYAGNYTEVTIDIDPDDEIELVGSTIEFKVYPQEFGQPVADEDPVITKDNGVDGTVVVVDPDEQTLKVPLEYADTVGLLRNYYHETTVTDGDGNPVTVAHGIMTVLGTENRTA